MEEGELKVRVAAGIVRRYGGRVTMGELLCEGIGDRWRGAMLDYARWVTGYGRVTVGLECVGARVESVEAEWPQHEDKYVRKLVAGMTLAEIAAAEGIEVDSLKRYLRKLY